MLSVVCGSSCALSAVEPVVSNRVPRPDEIGYRPADGQQVSLNPPSFIWLHEKPADRYAVQWSRQRDFREAVLVDDIPWNTYTHHSPLEAGTHYWRYRFTTSKGERSSWSAVRSVVVPAGAAVLPMPTRAQQRQRVGGAHPRLFVRKDDLARLRQAAAGPLAQEFKKLRDQADRLLRSEPTPEPTQRGSARNKDDLEAIKYWWPNRQQAEKACGEAETLAFVYLVTGEAKYGQAARKWVLHLASWDPDGPTNFALNCEAGKVMLYRPARAYDWAHDVFSQEDRRKIQAATRRRIADAWKSGEVRQGVGHFNSPYGSHANRIWHKIGETGIAFLGEIDEAETWVDYSVNKFFACYPVWSDDDGGWHEGVSYLAGYMAKAPFWLETARKSLGIDVHKKPFFAQVGDCPLYVCPPHSPNSGLGDLSYRPAPSSIGSYLDYHMRAQARQAASHAPYWRWWFDQWKMDGPDGVTGFLYRAMLGEAPPARSVSDLPQSKVFRGIGVASLHTDLSDARRGVHLLLKSSPFGTQSHGHNPHNSFQLNAYGEPLLVTCVYRDLHGSKFHYQYAHSTAAHNAVLVDGQGQTKHTSAPHGRIAASRLGKDFDWVVGEAAEAYEGRLTRFRRHAVLVKGTQPFVVLCDDLEAKAPATFQFMLHALQPFDLDEKAGRLTTKRKAAGLEVRYLWPAPLAMRQWDGFDPPPRKEFPNHWHVEAGTKDKAKDLRMVTVLLPYRGQEAPKWSARRDESPGAVVVTVTLDGRDIIVRIPRAEGEATVQRR